MITVRDIEQFLYDWAPPDTAESWDNVGLLVGRPARPGRRGGGGRGLCCALAAFSPWGLGVRGLRVWGALWPFWAGCAVFLRFGLNSSIENLRIVVFPGWCLPSAGTGSPQKRLRSMYFKSGCSYA